MRDFERDYEREQEISKAYREAYHAKDDQGMDAARDAIHALQAEQQAEGEAYTYVYDLYTDMKVAGNDCVDLGKEIIWDEQIPKIVEYLKACGITRFTFSSTATDAINTAMAFQKNDCTLQGMKKVNRTTKSWTTGKQDTESALMRRSKIRTAGKRIINYRNAGFYQVLSAETGTKHGLNVSSLIFDEIHAQPNRNLYDVLTKGSGDAREQPLFFIITTAGNDKNSICCELHTKALDIMAAGRHAGTAVSERLRALRPVEAAGIHPDHGRKRHPRRQSRPQMDGGERGHAPGSSRQHQAGQRTISGKDRRHRGCHHGLRPLYPQRQRRQHL